MTWRRVRLVVLTLVVLSSGCASAEVEPTGGPFSTTLEPSQPVARPDVGTVKDSIVRVIAFGCGAPALGSGFAVAPDLVVTSGHLVTGRDPETLAVLLSDGTEIGAVLVGFDIDRDLAALQLDVAVLDPVNLVTDVPLVEGVAVGLRSDDGEPIINEVEFVVDAPVIVNWDGIFRDSESQYRGIRIDAEVRKGDSGSGLFINDRDVIGVVQSRNRSGIPRAYAVGSADVAEFLLSVDPAREVVATRCA